MESYKVVVASSRFELLPETFGYKYRLKMRRLASEIIEKLDSGLVEYVKIEIVEKLWESSGETVPQMSVEIRGKEKSDLVAFKCSEVERVEIDKVVQTLHGRIK